MAARAPTFALCDGNAFYCSAERIFRPSLIGKPLIVLSNNDGCAIARSNEAKALGVKMGDPWFKIRHLEKEHGLVALSANFALYADISDRMMSVAGAFAPAQEIYSIDESFLLFDGVGGDLVARCREMRETVLQQVGIPCCVGLGPTKTLAKLANHIAKSAESKPGSYPAELARVCDLGAMSQAQREAILSSTAVGEVWGVGRRIGAQLEAAGVRTVLDLARLDPTAVRRRFSVVLEKTVRELQGVSCIDLDEAPAPKQQVMVSRSFGQAVTRGRDLAEAVSAHASRAAEKVRGQGSAAGAVMVFIRTSPFRTDDPQYSASVTVPLVRPSGDTVAIVSAAIAGLRRIYRSGFRYAKAGVMLVDLQDQDRRQAELDFGAPQADWIGMVEAGADPAQPLPRDRTRLMTAIDAVNRRHGRGSLVLAGTGLAKGPERGDKPWQMRQERRTPGYTTNWDEMPVVRA